MRLPFELSGLTDWMPGWMRAYGRNFYAVAGTVFFIWMLFFDSNDFLTQFGNWRRLREAYQEKVYYQEKVEDVRRDREELLNNPQLLETFAREKYLMKKPSEDLYLVVEE